ncbi:MAG TPA: PIG-L deacetylase family protein [Caulobacteraceae bacterium]|nr:PIG-L deacetylase family protein [Caulobacteraceae bacterium]
MGGLKPALLFGESALFAAFGAGLRIAAADRTQLLASRRTLVLAPHPDDESLGCGAIIRRLRDAGVAVRIVIATDGAQSHHSATFAQARLVALRRQEALDACAKLGVDAQQVIFLDLPDTGLAANTAALSERVLAQITEFQPEQVLYPSAIDSHPDHQALASVLEGLKGQSRLTCPVYGYPVWFWKLSTWKRPLRALRALAGVRLVKASTTGMLDHKRSAIAAHRSQFENLLDEPDWSFLPETFTRHFLTSFELFFEMKSQ